MVAAVGARALALAVIACAYAGPPAEAQPRALDADAAGLVARRYFEARHWGARACALLALGDRFHPDGAAAVLDALVGRDRRLVAFALEVLRACPDPWLAPVANAGIVDELVALTDDRTDLVRQRALEVLRRLAPFVDGESAASLARWWRETRPRYAPPLPPDEVRATGSVDVRYRQERLDELARALVLSGRELDLVICLDTSLSMADEIASARAMVSAMCDVLAGLVPGLQVGLVHYRDVDTLAGGAERLVPLTMEHAALERALAATRAEGGGDRLEAVDLALDLAFAPAMGWRAASIKHVVVVGDAPPRTETLTRLYAELRQRHFAAPDEAARMTVSAIDVGTAEDTRVVFGRIAELGGGHYHRVVATGGAIGSLPLLEPLLDISLGPRVRDVGRRLLAIHREYAAAGAFR